MNSPQKLLSAIALMFVFVHPLTGFGANISTLVSFNGTNGTGPYAGLLVDAAGNLYGTTAEGGANGAGTVFKITSEANTVTTLASFDVNNGAFPYAGLIADAAGNLYGTTAEGGTNGLGTVFKVVAGTNMLVTIASFNGTNGSRPFAELIADADGNLYGTTYDGGEMDLGTVFKVAAGTNTLTTLYSFDGVKGYSPYAALISDSAGNLYGTTSDGGEYTSGTVFKIAAGTNTFMNLLSFDGTNGSYPYPGLTSDSAGNFYGTTYHGGENGFGTVFKITAGTNTATTLASFYLADGHFPIAGLIVDSAGNVYGTTPEGGAYDFGTVFKIATGTNTVTTLVSFDETNGRKPCAGLIVDAAGNLYGTTFVGGASGLGTVFKITDSGFVVPETSALLLASFGLLALAFPCMQRARGAK